jgi:hypothetical protein
LGSPLSSSAISHRVVLVELNLGWTVAGLKWCGAVGRKRGKGEQRAEPKDVGAFFGLLVPTLHFKLALYLSSGLYNMLATVAIYLCSSEGSSGHENQRYRETEGQDTGYLSLGHSFDSSCVLISIVRAGRVTIYAHIPLRSILYSSSRATFNRNMIQLRHPSQPQPQHVSHLHQACTLLSLRYS